MQTFADAPARSTYFAAQPLTMEAPRSIGEGCDVVFLRPAAEPCRPTNDIHLYVDCPGSLKVTELGGGSVPVLRATNATDDSILIIAGQVLRGGKQNRGLNADVLLAPRSSADIPVTCVEAGRWSARPTGGFAPHGIEPLFIRAEKLRHVSSSRRAQWKREAAAAEREFRGPASGAPGSPAMDHSADQQAVWRMISELDAMSGARSGSSDLIASMELLHDASDRDIESVAGAGRCGMVVFMHGHFVGADVFGDPAWYAASEHNLLRSAFAMRRYAPMYRARERRDCADALAVLSESVLRDATHGTWVDGRPIGAERTSTLVHPYLEGGRSCTEDGRLLHVQLSTVAWLAASLN